MEKWIQMGRRLRDLINPSTFPAGVAFLEAQEAIPERARRPVADLGVRMAPCQGAAMARRYGWTVAFAREDVGCGIAAHTYGWDRLQDPEGAVEFLTHMNYASDPDSAREMLRGFRLLNMGPDPVVVFSPLEKTRIAPQVILIYVNPAQLMRLIHGCTCAGGKPIEGSFSGRAASCTEGALGAFLDRDAKVVVPGNGDRVWAGCQDHEMLLAVHAQQLEGLLEGLEKTHERGIRYPIPTYLRYQPEVGFAIPLADIFKKGEAQKIGRRNSSAK